MNSEHDRSKFSTPSDGLSPDLPQVDLPPVDLPTTAGLATPDRTSPQTGATEESPSTVAGLPPLAVGTDAASHLKKPATNELPPAADRSPAETVTNMFSQGDSHLDLRVGANAPADVGAAYENPSDAADLPVALPIPDAPAVPASPAPAGQTPSQSPSKPAALTLRVKAVPSAPHSKSQSPSKPAALTLPEKIGRFDVVRLLGKGGFGEVYLGRDATLRRDVALKIPNWKQANSAESEHEFLEEARRLVDVKGPGIVIVYEVLPVTLAGQSRICIVQEFIDGQNLAEWHAAQPKPIDIDRIAQLVAKIATILSLIHRQRVVHRDLKPANIMIDKAGRPYVLDFGLALHDNQRREHAGTVAGTFPYMSPEQVRAKTHRMDARSDIWSLGVILYELFSGQRPFGGSNSSQLCEEIQKKDPWPIRQLIPDFPPSLDRICLKCLNRLRNDRYTTMAELAAELRSWRDTPAATPPKASHSDNPSGVAPPAGVSSSPSSSPLSSPSSSLSSVSSFSSAVPARVIPRGLRSFTEADSDFFLDLLPGVRERSGLPESLDFWKRRIESDSPEYCVPIGLVFGPSGCGKSSLIKAGLLPRLEPRIIKVYLEATQDTTERQLLGLIRQRLPAIPAELGLPEVLEGLRQHRWLRSREKLLIVIDQFEQWLYAHRSEYAGELSDALQQCDGRRVQAILMVRDEYTPASFDFMNSLDIELAERRNFRKVSLFDLKHARKVLKLFGQAYEQLPMDDDACTADQNAFLDAAVAALDEDGDFKVVSVQVAMFAQLMERREWTPDTLQSLGGVHGVGLAFLRESFDSKDASPLCKRHADAALKVLTSLLPPPGAEIKGHSRTAEELATAAGYSARPADFAVLLQILDDELRLVTPAFDDSQKTVGYQLTHDYLVPSLTAWLEEKLRSSRRGRAQLRLQERTSAWTVKPENRHLPSLVEYARIATLTERSKWTEPQRRMMRRAGRVLATVCGATIMATTLTIAGALVFYSVQHREFERKEVRRAVYALQNAKASHVPFAIKDLQRLNRSFVLEELEQRYGAKSSPGMEENMEALKIRRLRLAQALASYGRADVDFLISSIAVADGDDYDNLAIALKTAQRSSWEPALRKAMTTADAAGRVSNDWKHKAKLALVGLHVGAPAVALDLHRLTARPDPTQQTQFIHDFFFDNHGDLSNLLQEAQSWNDAGLLYGMSLSLGKVPKRDFQASWSAWRDLVLRWHRNHPDSGVHSATGWALRQWGETLPDLSETPSRGPPSSRNWWPHELGFTMLRIHSGEFEHTNVLNRKIGKKERLFELWVADREVTVSLYQQFIDGNSDLAKAINAVVADKRVSPTSNHPMHQVSWCDAVIFCNWLSGRENRQPYYECNLRTNTYEDSGDWEVKVNPNGNGYRLLTAAEWEYCCRAGSSTQFCFGDSDQWLRQYATFYGAEFKRVSSPVCNHMCNRYGIFDMHGNVWEWCQDRADASLPGGYARSGFEISPRVLRGGSWDGTSADCRTPYRLAFDQARRSVGSGFRLALSTIGAVNDSDQRKIK